MPFIQKRRVYNGVVIVTTNSALMRTDINDLAYRRLHRRVTAGGNGRRNNGVSGGSGVRRRRKTAGVS